MPPPFRAADLAQAFEDAWRASCPDTPLLSHRASNPFAVMVLQAGDEAIAESRIYQFPDGSCLTCTRDHNGQYSAKATLTIHHG